MDIDYDTLDPYDVYNRNGFSKFNLSVPLDDRYPFSDLNNSRLEELIHPLLLHRDGVDDATVAEACRYQVGRIARELHRRGVSLDDVYARLEAGWPSSARFSIASLVAHAFDGVGGWYR